VIRVATLILALAIAVVPVRSAAAAGLEISGWIPYWKAKEGAKDARAHLDELDAIFPFAFTVKKDGSLKDEAKLGKSHWRALFDEARDEGVEVIPTIMSSDGSLIHRILSDEDSRTDHIAAIVKMVEKGGYDGVDIDYEGKRAATKDYFSAFLAELKDALGEGRTLSCTIEARTPLEDLYPAGQAPSSVPRANDLAAIGETCDRVNVMAYDQQRADLTENAAKRGEPYFPVADVDWVRKVARLMLGDIPAGKMHLGVPTYGRELIVAVAPDWFRDYAQDGALNPGYAEALAKKKKKKIEPYRAKSGELALTYFADRRDERRARGVEVPDDTPSGFLAAARALAYANETGHEIEVNFVTWSDAEAIGQKIDLAEELGLAGIAVFKIDGGEDQGLWRAVD
jgi:spore germination protein YaaH